MATKNSNIIADRGRTFPVDPTLPRWVCQSCRHNLDFSSRSSGMKGTLIHGSGSLLGSTGMDHSFVVLSKQRNQVQGAPPRPRSRKVQSNLSPSGKAMEESFVLLPPPAAYLYQCDSKSDGGGAHLPSHEGGTSSPVQSNNSGLHSTITALKRAVDIATTQMQVEQPLCLECMRVLSDKLDEEVEDVDRDIKAYEACLHFLEGEASNFLSEAEFFKEKLKIDEEERNLEAAIKETEKQYEKVTSELKELELKSIRFKELEERYWHKFNNFQFQLISHQEDGDAILAKIEVSQAHLELLGQTNVLYDAFPISYGGQFGTICNFRLGRLPKIPVEWDEINAAWGQACLLLHTMAQYFWPKFSYQIKVLPMGSYPRIMDSNNNAYELYGPVNLLWSTRYGEAMTLFLTCLKEFAEFANFEDKENNIPLEKWFKLPYKIVNNRVRNYSITCFDEQENWIKALKYTLCNLKWALHCALTRFESQTFYTRESKKFWVLTCIEMYRRCMISPSLDT
ncbi:hypothetical protein Vadar_008659 [Vaccinium darrowii]|uniref:Uncharacterized protein n=1 Tax=Vaccinium darrowii TaxID=229202 RepID=A0ACB7Z2N5_9ERIC|nr:hypothetical protein Vadar_008659 [Vaccinium darrowii]